MKKIQILGTGCAKCNELTANAKAAAQQVGEEVEFEKVTNINEIMKFGVMTTPGLVVDGKVVSQGKVLNSEQIAKFLRS
jgi:small redox-active disulfide protein 2